MNTGTANGPDRFGGANPDPTCTAASSASEACLSTDGVQQITAAATTGTTVGANNDGHPTCASSSNTAPDRTFRIDVPGMADLTIAADLANSWDGAVAL